MMDKGITFLILLLILMLGLFGWMIYDFILYENCMKEIAIELCNDKGLFYHRLDYMGLGSNEDSFICIEKSRRQIWDKYLFLEEEKESCR